MSCIYILGAYVCMHVTFTPLFFSIDFWLFLCSYITLFFLADLLPDEKVKRIRRKEKPIEFSYHKWAHLGVPMLISAGDDTKLFAYSVKEFTKFSPHDICPAPQRVPIQLVHNTVFNQTPLLLVQASHWLDILCVRTKNVAFPEMACGPSGGLATTDLLARIKAKASRKIICSCMSSSGELFAYSDHVRPSLFNLKMRGAGKSTWTVNKRKLPQKLPFAHSMVFSFDSSRLMIAGHDRRIYVSFPLAYCLCMLLLCFAVIFISRFSYFLRQEVYAFEYVYSFCMGAYALMLCFWFANSYSCNLTYFNLWLSSCFLLNTYLHTSCPVYFKFSFLFALFSTWKNY